MVERRFTRAIKPVHVDVRAIGNIVPIVFAITVTCSLVACSGAHQAAGPARPVKAQTAGTSSVRAAAVAPDRTVSSLGRAAGCAKVTTFAPTKPAIEGAFCTYPGGITLNLLVFNSTADRNAVLRFNYTKTHVSGYGKNWTVLALYDDFRPKSRRNKAVAADVTKATKSAGGTVLQ